MPNNSQQHTFFLIYKVTHSLLSYTYCLFSSKLSERKEMVWFNYYISYCCSTIKHSVYRERLHLSSNPAFVNKCAEIKLQLLQAILFATSWEHDEIQATGSTPPWHLSNVTFLIVWWAQMGVTNGTSPLWECLWLDDSAWLADGAES